MKPFRAVVVAATVVAASAVVASPAGAAPACGSTITSSMVLDADLTCPQQGLLINGTNITLDLGGHTISGAGPNTVPAAPFGLTAGVRVNVGSGVAVTNGTIRGFNAGVTTTVSANGNLITSLSLVGNRDGVLVQRTTSPVATSDNNRIIGNTVIGSTGTGINVQGSGNLVDGNTVTDGAGNAIGAAGTSSGTNVTVRNNTISRNILSNNARQFTGAAAVFVINAVNTVVTANTVSGVGTNPGIFVAGGTGTPSTGTQVTYNTAYGNADGIWMSANTSGSNVSYNRSVQNSSNGIRLTTTSATLTANAAYQNGALGIDALNGVTDGGGNKAAGNGNPQQCTPNIVCT
jgi:parallel beta-helix repeat protein